MPEETQSGEQQFPPVRISWMSPADLPAVLAIEREAFEFTWDEPDFRDAIHSRHFISLVATVASRVAGFAVCETRPTLIVLKNLAVHWEFRRRGIGRALLERVIAGLDDRSARRGARAYVRERNLIAQHFFAALDFRAVNVLRDFYDESPEDAIVFAYTTPPRP